MIVYQCDADGFYVGEAEDYGGPLPHGCVTAAPPILAGRLPRWNGRSWDQVENHVGEKGYVHGRPFTVKDYGPYPEGWSFDPPEPAAEEKIENLKARKALAEQRGERSSREIHLGLAERHSAPAEDGDRLKAVEVETAG